MIPMSVRTPPTTQQRQRQWRRHKQQQKCCYLTYAVSFIFVPLLLQGRMHPIGVDALMPPPLNNIIGKSLASYSIYSFLVDKYAKRKVELMKIAHEEGNDRMIENKRKMTPKELRQTISKRNWIVMDPKDRLDWNHFIVSPPPPPSPPLSKMLDFLCGTYEFAYRSYVNVEEVNAICKPFFNWKQFSLVLKQKGRLTIYKEGGEGGTSESVDDLYVTNVEMFRFGLFLPLTIQWYGKIVPCTNNIDFKIVWTKTEMKVGKLISVDNPKVSTKLSSTPWGIVKLEDGMICFKRGDIGYLVYDIDASTLN